MHGSVGTTGSSHDEARPGFRIFYVRCCKHYTVVINKNHIVSIFEDCYIVHSIYTPVLMYICKFVRMSYYFLPYLRKICKDPQFRVAALQD